jgi:crotonobetainyl-CoA:carnitine CoA-transferase CaiB-like acyl-CoA transferase
VIAARVLDFTHVFAGPFCTRTLADLGADIAHVESRSRDPGDRHRAAYTHRNKRSLCLDLKNPAGRAVAMRLAAVADVVVENFSANVMRRLGLDYDALAAVNPQLIFLSLSGYGHTGPRSSWTSMNMNLQAYTGLMLATGAEGDPPTAIANSWNDYIGGLHGVVAVLQALAERAATGRGRHIDLSQFECSVATLGPLLLASQASGAPPQRRGNRSELAAPQGVYPCAGEDEWCAIAVRTDGEWRALATALGRDDLAADARYATTGGRLAAHDELDAAIAAWTRARTPRDAERCLQTAGVPAERMRRVDDVVASDDSARGFRLLPGDRPRPVLVPTLPFSFRAGVAAPVAAPPALGADTEAVLREWLEMDAAEFAALDADGAFV